ncbi:biotin-dependent carboxyltransferase family protein [Jannaschia rubra]|uniref:5-oxoprolinase subunit C family protein n=1 Tax=Jannaschia rubra TaxID=282197 RepID=UPI002491ED9D|nr:urea amidolyase [Jannaschia rubra]
MIEVLACGPLVTVQDGGRPGWLADGLAEGGAADRRALEEARALLGHAGAGIETPGAPLRLKLHVDTTVALTGAPMRAAADGRALAWNACHPLPTGTVLDLRPTGEGVYSYVHVGGGLTMPEVLGSRSAHLIAGIGEPLAPGDSLPCAALAGAARRVAAADRMGGGLLRLLPTPQTRMFSRDAIERFENAMFRRDARGNRQGVRLTSDGQEFATEGQLGLLSDFILPGDVQMTGDGVPYILGPECQTTGGYPRIGSVIAADLPRALQAVPGAKVRFRFVTLAEAQAARPGQPTVEPLTRDPAEVPDLLSLQLVGGVVSAREDG